MTTDHPGPWRMQIGEIRDASGYWMSKTEAVDAHNALAEHASDLERDIAQDIASKQAMCETFDVLRRQWAKDREDLTDRVRVLEDALRPFAAGCTANDDEGALVCSHHADEFRRASEAMAGKCANELDNLRGVIRGLLRIVDNNTCGRELKRSKAVRDARKAVERG